MSKRERERKSKREKERESEVEKKKTRTTFLHIGSEKAKIWLEMTLNVTGHENYDMTKDILYLKFP